MNNQEYFSQDIYDFLLLLTNYEVRYLIVGDEAIIYYGYARLTGNIDIFYDLSEDNIDKLYSVLEKFWDNDIPGIEGKDELAKSGYVFQFGLPPNRIDLINKIEGIDFNKAWPNRKDEIITYQNKEFEVHYIGLNDLIKNKRATGRYKDKDDLKFLKGMIKKTNGKDRGKG
jgi:predicted nucleotidyltransferase